jgi:hypothetical protein
MILNIFGVGKSGTTAIYSSLQSIMLDQLEEKIGFFYEPFLRDSDYIGGPYEESIKKFRYIDSLSAEGIFNHTSIPLLYSSAIAENSPFLDKIYGASNHSNGHSLVKYIRANGRYRLISNAVPDAKSIFIIRNPVDVANSIKGRFSFYGGEFHKDDEARFIEEVNQHFDKSYTKSSFRNHLHTQLFYWYYMNRFALESFQGVDSPPLVICYEYFFSSLATQLPKLLSHTNLDYKSKYLELFSAPSGPVSSVKALTKNEADICRDYQDRYLQLLTEHQISTDNYSADPLARYTITDEQDSVKSQLYGLHGRAIERKLKPKNVLSKKPLFLHIINPVIVGSDSDLHAAQPITFKTMESAKSYAELAGIKIAQVAAFYPEDASLIPDSFERCPPLTRSCLDFGSFTSRKKLPLLGDILSAAYDHSDAEYIIYTNVDIALMPHFYVTAKKLLEEGHDVISIFRRTLDSSYTGIDNIPLMYSELGEDHPGSDCFIIKRELVDKLDLQNVVIGSQFVAFALRANLHSFATKIEYVRRSNMTFHIGDDRTWSTLNEHSEYNANEVDQMFESLFERKDITKEDELIKFHKEFQHRKRKSREGISQ